MFTKKRFIQNSEIVFSVYKYILPVGYPYQPQHLDKLSQPDNE